MKSKLSSTIITVLTAITIVYSILFFGVMISILAGVIVFYN